MENIVLEVEGMECEGCENRIKKALSSMKEVEEVKADYKTGIVEIKVNDDIDEEEVIERLEDLGFFVK